MSIANEITRLSNAKADIVSAIVDGGVEVPNGLKLHELAEYIRLIYYKTVPDFLYNAGDQCEDATGGWTMAYGHLFQLNETSIKLQTAYANSDVYPEACCYTIKRIDLTKIAALRFDYTMESPNPGVYNWTYCGVSKDVPTTYASMDKFATNDGVLDVADLSGEYYVCFCNRHRGALWGECISYLNRVTVIAA